MRGQPAAAAICRKQGLTADGEKKLGARVLQLEGDLGGLVQRVERGDDAADDRTGVKRHRVFGQVLEGAEQGKC